MFRNLILMLVIFFMATVATASSIPRYLNYQSVLFDDGGNPLPDGTTRIYFSVLDANLDAVYEEVQDVEVVGGVVSVMVGAGKDLSSGGLTGGIGPDTLNPEGARYLEVEAEGYPPENLMELVSVPYSAYSEVAMSVQEGGIGTEQIREGSIKMEHLTDDLVTRLTNEIVGTGGNTTIVVREEFENYKSSISGTGGAGSVGISPDFTYSSATNVRDVIKDLDMAVKKREEDVGWARKDYTDKIAAEETARKGADSGLQNSINAEASARQGADATLQKNIGNEATARANADSVLQQNIDAKVSKSGDTMSGDLIVEGGNSIILRDQSGNDVMVLNGGNGNIQTGLNGGVNGYNPSSEPRVVAWGKARWSETIPGTGAYQLEGGYRVESVETINELWGGKIVRINLAADMQNPNYVVFVQPQDDDISSLRLANVSVNKQTKNSFEAAFSRAIYFNGSYTKASFYYPPGFMFTVIGFPN